VAARGQLAHRALHDDAAVELRKLARLLRRNPVVDDGLDDVEVRRRERVVVRGSRRDDALPGPDAMSDEKRLAHLLRLAVLLGTSRAASREPSGQLSMIFDLWPSVTSRISRTRQSDPRTASSWFRKNGSVSLPAGTVTFVFSDIERSTDLLKRLGDGYGDLLADHRRILRETFAAHGGVEIDSQGDAFFFAFARARDAATAAVAAQRAHAGHEWPDGEQVRVRMGLHTGEPAVGEEGYLGLDVVRAARICTAGQGGHVLLSEATRALLGSALPDGVSVHPLGERRLKDLDEPERVYELVIEGVEQPAATPPAQPASDDDFDLRAADLGRRLSAEIREQVLTSLEESLQARGRRGRRDRDR
jgi:class 3 adenylate cyclase